jgi:hypothetical protein
MWRDECGAYTPVRHVCRNTPVRVEPSWADRVGTGALGCQAEPARTSCLVPHMQAYDKLVQRFTRDQIPRHYLSQLQTLHFVHVPRSLYGEQQ